MIRSGAAASFVGVVSTNRAHCLALLSLLAACSSSSPPASGGGGGGGTGNESGGRDGAPGPAPGGASGAAAGSGGLAQGGQPPSTTGGATAGGGAPSSEGGSAGAPSTAGTGGVAGAPGSANVVFRTRVLATDHVAEGADVGDIDGDGKVDLVAGPRWYKGPEFTLGGTIIESPPTYTRDQYSKFFLTFVDDVNGDGRPDVIGIGDAGGGNGTGTPNAHWYQNPGPAGLAQPWTKSPLYSGLVSNESPAYVNLVGDAKRELVFMTAKTAGYATPAASPTAAWTYQAVTTPDFNTPYVHGLGVGDIDGDGKADLVERTGVWRQTEGATWQRQAFAFGKSPPSNWGGAQMQVFDVDGDGDNDVVSSLAAHGYGLSWFEQTQDSASPFVSHTILEAAAGPGNVSQLHALVAADVNGDGLTDLVAGKRYYAHPSSNADPGTDEPPLLLWFELKRGPSGATFVPHQVHGDSGAGCNFVAQDVTGDGKVDIFTTNKRGTFLHVQE